MNSQDESPGQRARRMLGGATPWPVDAVSSALIIRDIAAAEEAHEATRRDLEGTRNLLAAASDQGMEVQRLMAEVGIVLDLGDDVCSGAMRRAVGMIWGLERERDEARERVAALEAVIERVRPVVEALAVAYDTEAGADRRAGWRHMTAGGEGMEALARQVEASPSWRWLPGMLTESGLRVLGERESPVDVDGNQPRWDDSTDGGLWCEYPDLSDRPTLAAMEGLVMRLTGADDVLTDMGPHLAGPCRVWALLSTGWLLAGNGRTRAEAIVDAILRQEVARVGTCDPRRDRRRAAFARALVRAVGPTKDPRDTVLRLRSLLPTGPDPAHRPTHTDLMVAPEDVPDLAAPLAEYEPDESKRCAATFCTRRAGHDGAHSDRCGTRWEAELFGGAR